MCVTDRHDMTLAVKVALNPNTTKQSDCINCACWVRLTLLADTCKSLSRLHCIENLNKACRFFFSYARPKTFWFALLHIEIFRQWESDLFWWNNLCEQYHSLFLPLSFDKVYNDRETVQGAKCKKTHTHTHMQHCKNKREKIAEMPSFNDVQEEVAEPHSSVGSVADLRTGGRWFDCRLGQYSFGSHCDRIHSSLIAVRCFDNDYVGKQPVAWKEYCAEYWLKDLHESMGRCTGRRDIMKYCWKLRYTPYNQSINQSIRRSRFKTMWDNSGSHHF